MMIVSKVNLVGPEPLMGAFESEEIKSLYIRVEAAADRRQYGAAVRPGSLTTNGGRGLRHGGGRCAAPRADFQHNLRRRRGYELLDELADTLGAVLVDPVDDVAIRGQQPQRFALLDSLQRPNPGVEMLFRQLGFEPVQALVPERSLHEQRFSLRCNGSLAGKGAGVYTRHRPVDILKKAGVTTRAPG